MIADAKRGDVPSTAAAYSRALTGPPPGLAADAITANPLMGRDALAPLIDGARARGAGAFLLVRTSNPGAADVLDLELADGRPLWERLAAMTAELGAGDAARRRRRRHRRHRSRAPRAHARADAAHAVPAARHRRPGRRRRRARAGLRTRPRGRPRVRLALDRRAPARRAGATPREAARAEAERLREAAWDLA